MRPEAHESPRRGDAIISDLTELKIPSPGYPEISGRMRDKISQILANLTDVYTVRPASTRGRHVILSSFDGCVEIEIPGRARGPGSPDSDLRYREPTGPYPPVFDLREGVEPFACLRPDSTRCRAGLARRRIAAWASPTRLFGAEVRVMPC